MNTINTNIKVLSEEEKQRIITAANTLINIDKKFVVHLEKLVTLASRMPSKYFTTIQFLNMIIP
jgi:hypothetical protein